MNTRRWENNRRTHRVSLDHAPSVPAALLAHPPIAAALRIILLGNARPGQANQFSERRVRPAGTARQRRGKGCHGRAPMPVERPQVDIARGTAGRAARPQEPIAGSDGGAGLDRHELHANSVAGKFFT